VRRAPSDWKRPLDLFKQVAARGAAVLMLDDRLGKRGG